MTLTLRELDRQLESFRAKVLPDNRTQCLDVTATELEDGFAVEATVTTYSQANALFDFLQSFSAVDREASNVTVLEGLSTEATVSRLTLVRTSPDSDAEQITQVLYGDTVTAYDRNSAWRRVRVPDGYLGWIQNEAICQKFSQPTNAIVTQDVDVPDVPGGTVPTGTPCRVDSPDAIADTATIPVTFQTGVTASLPEDSLHAPIGLPAGGAVVATAKQFLGTPYEWGGMTRRGIDCSGLIWIAYRVHGFDLPRDSDQLRLVGEPVARDELQPGDVLCFPGHVALSLGGYRYLHAYGSSNGVVENSLDPTDSNYLESLDDDLKCCRRIVPSD